jgi:hypothetical protein
LLIQEGYGAEIFRQNNYEMIEKFGYLISLSRQDDPISNNPLRPPHPSSDEAPEGVGEEGGGCGEGGGRREGRGRDGGR